MPATDVSELRRAFAASLEAFIARVEALPEDAFLGEVDGRSPRDIVAHIIGWNRLAVAGHAAQRRGELPDFWNDAGNDFRNVNRESMARYASRDRDELLGELRRSAAELDALLAALPPGDADDNHGMTFRGRPVTLGGLVRALMHDHREHGEELKGWNAERGTRNDRGSRESGKARRE